MDPGNIVRCRNRDWVLLPSEDTNVQLLRPLTGATDEVVAVHRALSELIADSLQYEKVSAATFPLPTVHDLADASSADLLWQAARLTLREGAAPFRSLGRISIRPRVYQFVPLLMALRSDPVRLLIADDVGVGKTIEALLIARELLDRGEIARFCVLCPPYLCEQWQKELAEKFNLDAVIVRSGTIGQLERRKTSNGSIYRHYPVQVVSIDFIKSGRNRHQFLTDCPDLVIVDEAHGCTNAAAQRQTHHQRNALINRISEVEGRHLILLTATPHSGVEDSFRSLLGFLRPEFAKWDTNSLSEPQRDELVKHFVQRTRFDIMKTWEGDHCFPTRISRDEIYRLSKGYRELFARTYEFCCEIVQSGQSLDGRQRRVRYWGALVLLRCVMSSPVAAVAALKRRHDRLETESTDDEPQYRSFIFESDEEATEDDTPSSPVETAEATMSESERSRLRELGTLAAKLKGPSKDQKVARCTEIASELLEGGHYPIIWCRYVDTAEYVAETLAKSLKRKHKGVRVIAITGRMGDEERQEMVEELSAHKPRVLVATDCLSEGINLQRAFDAVLHYDLPWNPNRLEQREGRVDRYMQPSEEVHSIRFFSPDSAVDGVVIDVLLDKAKEIHKALGTHMPVPVESETVTEALLNALFLRGDSQATPDKQQMRLDFGDEEEVIEFHRRWDRDKEREKINRTRFAQRALKPAEVQAELEEADAVLGDPSAVRNFVLNAGQRLGMAIVPGKEPDAFIIEIGEPHQFALPRPIAFALPSIRKEQWKVSFSSPTPDGCEYLGRNHRFVSALARFLMEEAMTNGDARIASRCGVIRTKSVERLTVLMSLRVRYLLKQPQRTPLLCEEVVVMAIQPNGDRDQFEELPENTALTLLAEAKPDANVPMPEKRELITAMLECWPNWQPSIEERIEARSKELRESYSRIRQAVSLRVRELSVQPQLPPDLLGILVLQPVAKA